MITRFLALLEDPAAGRDLHACYAPDAPLYLDHAVRRAGELDADAFAAYHRRAEGRSFRAPELLLDAGEVAWYRAEADRPVVIALGRRDGRVGWLTLAEAVDPAWTYEHGLRATLSTYAYARPAGLAVPRSWLDLAHHGLYAHEDVRFETLPEARWACHGSTRCCSKPFETIVEPAAQALIDTLPADLAVKLPVLPDGNLQLKHDDDTCRFLDAANRCRVHGVLGFQPFAVCASYPIVFAETPEAVRVTAQFTCGSARESLGPPIIDQRPMLRRLLAMKLRPAAVPARDAAATLAPGTAAEPAAADADAAERAILAALEGPELLTALRAALDIVGCSGQPGDELDFEKLRLEMTMAPYMFQLGVPLGAVRAPSLTPHPQDAVLLRLARAVVFGRKLTTAFGLRGTVNAIVFMAALAAHARSRLDDDVLTEPLLHKLAGWFMHDAFKRLVQEDDPMGAYMRGRLASPEFGPFTLATLGA